MIRLYSNAFYNDPDAQNDYEVDYISRFNNFSGNTKYENMVDVCLKTLPQLEQICGILNFPHTFNDLLILRPETIAEIYHFYLDPKNINFKKILDDNFRPLVPQLDKHHNQKLDDKGNKLYHEKYILDYEYAEYSNAIAQLFIDYEPKGYFNVNTCNYCNMSYINTFKFINHEGITETKRIYELDHFIPKSKCSLFALSLYNFVPSCKVCNHLKSDDVDFSLLTSQKIAMLFPTSKNYNYEQLIKFRMKYKDFDNFPNFGFLKDSEGNDIRQDYNIVIKKNRNAKIYEDYEEKPFKILARYEPHKTEFLNYMEKHIKYPPAFFLMFSQSISMYDAEDLKEAIFNVKLRNKERQIFQKIYNDLDEQF